MPITQIATGRAFSYMDNIGQIGTSGPSLRHPVGLARGANDVLYVANWGTESQGGARITKCVMSTQEWLADIGQHGSGDGEFIWPGGLVADSDENLYLTDQADSKVVIFDKEGGFIAKWGEEGSGEGQMFRPSGIALDSQGNLLISDTRNHRIQKFTKDGQFLGSFGSYGSGEGEFDLPWGLDVDADDNVYVADWGNNRVQKLSASGEHLQTFGEPGNGRGQLDHPSDVSVDKDGDVFVADWANNRAIIYQPDGTFLVTLIGDATNLSEWAKSKVAANPDLAKARMRADLEPEWRLWHPAAILVDDDYNILIAEAQHMRVQIYQKDPDYFEAQFTL